MIFRQGLEEILGEGPNPLRGTDGQTVVVYRSSHHRLSRGRADQQPQGDPGRRDQTPGILADPRHLILTVFIHATSANDADQLADQLPPIGPGERFGHQYQETLMGADAGAAGRLLTELLAERELYQLIADVDPAEPGIGGLADAGI